MQAGVDSNTAGRAEAFSAVAGASGPVTSLSVYVDASATATRAPSGSTRARDRTRARS